MGKDTLPSSQASIMIFIQSLYFPKFSNPFKNFSLWIDSLKISNLAHLFSLIWPLVRKALFLVLNYGKFSGGQKLFICKQKYGILEWWNDHKISTLSGISLKICLLSKSNTVFPFLEFREPELQVRYSWHGGSKWNKCILILRWLTMYSFLKKKTSILKSVKLKQQDVSAEVLVTAIGVKCNFI